MTSERTVGINNAAFDLLVFSLFSNIEHTPKRTTIDKLFALWLHHLCAFTLFRCHTDWVPDEMCEHSCVQSKKKFYAWQGNKKSVGKMLSSGKFIAFIIQLINTLLKLQLRSSFSRNRQREHFALAQDAEIRTKWAHTMWYTQRKFSESWIMSSLDKRPNCQFVLTKQVDCSNNKNDYTNPDFIGSPLVRLVD